MKSKILTGVMAATILIAGCSKQAASVDSSATPPKGPAATAASSPVAQPALTVWLQGDKAAAVGMFLATDWSARPLFAAGSTLSLSEGQFKALSEADREAKSGELMAQIDLLKQLAAAVVKAGRDAASQGDVAQARKYFASLQQSGAALDSPDCLQLVQIVGRGFKKASDKEMAKIGQ
jgi:hypothetical protein